jgi:gamma-butyrobetaine dioxygenase
VSADDAVRVLAEKFASEGAAEYLGEPVTQAAHMLRGTDTRHGEAGAAWLAQWFGPEVTEPVRLHVAAKRYLCAAEPDYLAALSPASVYTLGVQGGPMQGPELAEFEAHPYASAAIRVRRWDDQAKEPEVEPPPFSHFEPVLRALAR